MSSESSFAIQKASWDGDLRVWDDYTQTSLLLINTEEDGYDLGSAPLWYGDHTIKKNRLVPPKVLHVLTQGKSDYEKIEVCRISRLIHTIRSFRDLYGVIHADQPEFENMSEIEDVRGELNSLIKDIEGINCIGQLQHGVTNAMRETYRVWLIQNTQFRQSAMDKFNIAWYPQMTKNKQVELILDKAEEIMLFEYI